MHASEAIGELLSRDNDDQFSCRLFERTLERSVQYLQTNLTRAHSQAHADERLRAVQFIPPSLLTAMTASGRINPSSSLNALSSGIRTAAGGWGCCLDCAAVRKSGECDWESKIVFLVY